MPSRPKPRRIRPRPVRPNPPALGWQDALTGAVIVGIPAVLWWRSRMTQAATLPPGVPTTPLRPVPPPAALEPPARPLSAPLVQRLLDDERTRQIYYFQALLYSYGFTDEVPDGLFGPITRRLANEVRMIVRLPPVVAWIPELVGDAQVAVLTRYGVGWPPSRVVPDRWPQSLVDKINASARRAAGGGTVIPLQSLALRPTAD